MRAERPVWVVGAAMLSACAACASLAGTRQVVSFDSTQRGVQVRDGQGEFLGTTPFFANIERERTHDLALSRPFGPTQHYLLRCKYRWGGSLLGNVPTGALVLGGGLPAAGLVFAGAAGVDLMTGAAFECPRAVLLPSPPSPADGPGTVEVNCPAYVVVPPPHEDGKVSRLLADAAADRLLRAIPCARRVDPAATDAIFRRHGVTHEKAFKADSYGRARLNDLGMRTGATHLVVLGVHDRGDDLDVAPEVADLHTLASVRPEPFTVDLRRDERAPRHPVRAWLGRNVQVLPNSLGFAPATKELAWQGRGGRHVFEDRPAASRVPDLIGNWTLLSVDHPGGWEAWDVGAKLRPDVVFGWHERSLDIGTSRTAPDLHTTRVRIVQSGLVYAAVGTLHTPIGAFSASAGLGAGLAWHWRDGSFHDWDASSYAAIGVAWTAFVSENLFLRLGVTSTASGSPHATGPDYALDAWTVTSLTLGWYVPEWRSRVRAWF